MQSFADQIKLTNSLNWNTFPEIMNYLNYHLSYLQPHVGEYKISARSEDFEGWMICDGRSVSKSNNAILFDILGTSFGSEDEDTFKLPDLRGRVIAAIGQGSNLTNRSLGDAVGTETHTLGLNEIPSHSHVATASNAGTHSHALANSGLHSHSVTDPGHTHTFTSLNDDYNAAGGTPPGVAADSGTLKTWNNIQDAFTNISIDQNGTHTHSMSNSGDHTHSIAVSSTGGSNAHNIMQPTLFAGNVFIFGGRTQ